MSIVAIFEGPEGAVTVIILLGLPLVIAGLVLFFVVSHFFRLVRAKRQNNARAFSYDVKSLMTIISLVLALLAFSFLSAFLYESFN